MSEGTAVGDAVGNERSGCLGTEGGWAGGAVGEGAGGGGKGRQRHVLGLCLRSAVLRRRWAILGDRRADFATGIQLCAVRHCHLRKDMHGVAGGHGRCKGLGTMAVHRAQ